MMNKFFAMILIAVLALSCTAAFAATYNDPDHDITFEYDETKFEITMDDHTDDEDLIILDGKDEAWGNTFISIYLHELDDGETFATMSDFDEMVAQTGDVVTQGDWNGYKDVFMYTVDFGDSTESYFIAPVRDDDGEIEDSLTVRIGVTKLDDEAAAMERDDLISAVVDSLKIDD